MTVTKEAIEAAWAAYQKFGWSTQEGMGKAIEADLSTLPIAGEGNVFGTFVERNDGSTEFRRAGEPHSPTAQGYKAWTLYAGPPSSPGKDGGQQQVGTGVFENGEMIGFIGLGDEFNPDAERPRDTRPIFTTHQPYGGQEVEAVNPMQFFSENVDRWGAAEWFNRLAMAIREQDKACVAKDDISLETYRMIAASSAMTLVRDHEATVRAALSSQPASTALVERLTKALEEISDTRCVHDMGFDREIGPLGCSLGDKCVCVGLCTIASRALQEITTKALEGQAVAWRWKWKDCGSWIVTEGEPDANERRIIEPLYKSAHVAEPVEYHIVFDGFPSPDGPRFIEVENAAGQSINAGEWRKRADGLCELVIKAGAHAHG